MVYIGDIEYDDKLDHKCIIYGVGINGKNLLGYLKKHSLEKHVLCFCVSDQEEIKEPFCEEYKVLTISEAKECYPDADYLIKGKYANEMIEECEKNGIKSIHFYF